MQVSVRTASGSDRIREAMRKAPDVVTMIRSLPLAVLALCTRLCLVAVFCLFVPPASAQNLRVVIRVVPESNRAIVEGSFIPTKVWSFRDSYAGVLGLGARVERLKLFDN